MVVTSDAALVAPREKVADVKALIECGVRSKGMRTMAIWQRSTFRRTAFVIGGLRPKEQARLHAIIIDDWTANDPALSAKPDRPSRAPSFECKMGDETWADLYCELDG